MLITHARIDIKNSWPRSRLTTSDPPYYIQEDGRIKAGFRIVIRRDRVHVISEKDQERQSKSVRSETRRGVSGRRL